MAIWNGKYECPDCGEILHTIAHAGNCPKCGTMMIKVPMIDQSEMPDLNDEKSIMDASYRIVKGLEAFLKEREK